MKRTPKFDPSLSVQTNAERMGVSKSTIYHHLSEKNISRKKVKQEILIKEIRSAIEANPDASQKTIAQITKHGIATINKYWKVALGLEVLDKPKQFVWKSKIADENKKALFSEMLKDANEIIQYAEQMDVRRFHDFLFEKSEMPMFFVGNGGMKNHYAAMLYRMNNGVGVCITPYMLASLSDETIKNSRFLIMSAKGKNQDADYAAKLLTELNPENTGFFTHVIDDKNKVYKRFRDKSKVFLFSNPHSGGFISSRSKIFTYSILYKAFTGQSLKDYFVDLTPEKCYQYQLNNSTEKITPPTKINHFLVLYGSYSEPVAMDFESVLAETGMASAQVTDFRNYCHGRFIFAANHTRHNRKGHKLNESDAAIVFLVTPRNKKVVEYLRNLAVPTNMPILTIETDYDSPLATIDLLIKANVFLADLGEKGYGINPNSPPNYSHIDKEDPISKVLFKSELNGFGEMSL